MDKIEKLSSEELVNKLQHFGESAGPVTASTRRIFEKRLYKHLYPDKTTSQAPPAVVPAQKESETAHDEKGKVAQSQTTVPAAAQDAASQERSPPAPAEKQLFFGVQLPLDAQSREDVRVFTDKSDVLKLMKRNPGSRFKMFPSKGEAETFSRRPPEQVPMSPKPTSPFPVKDPPRSPPVSEGSVYRGPKPQEIIALRRAIEAGNVAVLRQLLWANPRSLISSGDTPTILQEGFRYNALHVAAMKNQPESAKVILDTIEDPAFIRLLYPEDQEDTRWNRIQFLSDLYLNTPDKGNWETPLHFACKFGFTDVVDTLSSHPRVDKHRKNKYGESPSDVTCTRSRSPSQGIKQKIMELLEDRYYVPLLRSHDNSCPPRVAKPCSPAVETAAAGTPGGGAGSVGGPEGQSPGADSPKNSPLAIRACAGPMSPSQADKFRHSWLRPPSPSPQDRRRYAEVRRGDSEKGMERIGRALAQTMKVPWSEYWDFLDSYLDLSSAEGLAKLEAYLGDQEAAAQREAALTKDLQFVEAHFGSLRLHDGPESGRGHWTGGSPWGGPRPRSGSDAATPPPEREARVNVFSPSSPVDLRNTVLKIYMPSSPGGSSPPASPASPAPLSPATPASPAPPAGVTSPNREPGAGDNESLKRVLLPELTEDSNPTTTATTIVVTEESDQSATQLIEITNNSSSPVTSPDSSAVTSSVRADGEGVAGRRSKEGSQERESIQKGSLALSRQPSDRSNASDSSFHTAEDDLDLEYQDVDDLEAPAEQSTPTGVFLHGGEPTKADLDALRALDLAHVSPEKHPRVAQWLELIKSYSPEVRSRWTSPRRRQRALHSEPRRPPVALSSSWMSPSSSDQSNDSFSESDTSFNGMSNVRANLMSSFMSER